MLGENPRSRQGYYSKNQAFVGHWLVLEGLWVLRQSLGLGIIQGRVKGCAGRENSDMSLLETLILEEAVACSLTFAAQ